MLYSSKLYILQVMKSRRNNKIQLCSQIMTKFESSQFYNQKKPNKMYMYLHTCIWYYTYHQYKYAYITMLVNCWYFVAHVGIMLAYGRPCWLIYVGPTLYQPLAMMLARLAKCCWANVFCQHWPNQVANWKPTLAQLFIAIWVTTV